jgi:hypothetical protein
VSGSLEAIFGDLMASDELTAEKILQYLLTSDKHLALKTHVMDPTGLAIYRAFLQHMRNMKLPKSEKVMKEFLLAYLEFMVSYKRLSREEVIKALTSLRTEKSTLAEKMMGKAGE